jgi:hypothetical protein
MKKKSNIGYYINAHVCEHLKNVLPSKDNLVECKGMAKIFSEFLNIKIKLIR